MDGNSLILESDLAIQLQLDTMDVAEFFKDAAFREGLYLKIIVSRLIEEKKDAIAFRKQLKETARRNKGKFVSVHLYKDGHPEVRKLYVNNARDEAVVFRDFFCPVRTQMRPGLSKIITLYYSEIIQIVEENVGEETVLESIPPRPILKTTCPGVVRPRPRLHNYPRLPMPRRNSKFVWGRDFRMRTTEEILVYCAEHNITTHSVVNRGALMASINLYFQQRLNSNELSNIVQHDIKEWSKFLNFGSPQENTRTIEEIKAYCLENHIPYPRGVGRLAIVRSVNAAFSYQMQYPGTYNTSLANVLVRKKKWQNFLKFQ